MFMIHISADEKMLNNYFHTLINLFYKILPLWECEEPSRHVYVKSLQLELLGCKELLEPIKEDAGFVSLISILQYFIDHPDSPTHDIKREVFKAIRICKTLEDRYALGGDTK